ncbi:MAG TPA: anti-sigma factor [Burkholderiales bacterium]|nr:anti-sigma factor [Burkholderiales bacterium]
MNCDETRYLIHGHLDKEIDLVRAVEIEKHLEDCAECKALYSQGTAMRSAIRERASYYAEPKYLEARIRAALPKPRKKTIVFGQPGLGWLRFAASMAFAAVITWGVALHFNAANQEQRLTDEIISGHVRSLMGDHLADVASSDQHTVKPWFNGKLDFSPEVLDLTAQDFPLVGGRLDYINDRPVAALVYRHRKHYINLFVWPVESGENSVARSESERGYSLIHWRNSGMQFWAVSDLNATELMQFAGLLQQPAAPR